FPATSPAQQRQPTGHRRGLGRLDAGGVVRRRRARQLVDDHAGDRDDPPEPPLLVDRVILGLVGTARRGSRWQRTLTALHARAWLPGGGRRLIGGDRRAAMLAETARAGASALIADLVDVDRVGPVELGVAGRRRAARRERALDRGAAALP